MLTETLDFKKYFEVLLWLSHISPTFIFCTVNERRRSIMCNGFGGGCSWIIIIILILLCCGGCGCGNDCGCNNCGGCNNGCGGCGC